MKLKLLIITILFIFAAMFSIGCNGNNPQNNQEQSPSKEVISNYFPLNKGSTWQYQGKGIEYASFNREVLFTQGNKAQIKEDNGGTVSTAVFKVTENKISRIFFKGETYKGKNYLNSEPNDNTVILKGPLKEGTSWGKTDRKRKIVAIDAAVNTPAGKFKDCIKVKISGEDSTTFEYYKAGVGMVKREYISGETEITSSLKNYKVTE